MSCLKISAVILMALCLSHNVVAVTENLKKTGFMCPDPTEFKDWASYRTTIGSGNRKSIKTNVQRS